MRILVLALLGLAVSMSVHASEELVSVYAAKSLELSESACPEISTARVQISPVSQQIVKAGLRLSNGSTLVVEDLMYNQDCISNGVCNGFDTGLIDDGVGGGTIVSFRHNNDGGHPTKDEPGYNYVDLTNGSQTCAYALTVAAP